MNWTTSSLASWAKGFLWKANATRFVVCVRVAGLSPAQEECSLELDPSCDEET